jgi:hypothetical protein
MPLRDIRHLIGASSELEAVRKNAQRQAALQRAYQDYCDSTATGLAYLTKASRVGYIKAGTLYLLADQAAVAAKLRQLLPRLLPVLSKLDAEVTGIKVVLQANFPPQQHTNQMKKNPLPVDSIQQFENLSQSVHDPALKSALARLARNQRKERE